MISDLSQLQMDPPQQSWPSASAMLLEVHRMVRKFFYVVALALDSEPDSEQSQLLRNAANSLYADAKTLQEDEHSGPRNYNARLLELWIGLTPLPQKSKSSPRSLSPRSRPGSASSPKRSRPSFVFKKRDSRREAREQYLALRNFVGSLSLALPDHDSETEACLAGRFSSLCHSVAGLLGACVVSIRRMVLAKNSQIQSTVSPAHSPMKEPMKDTEADPPKPSPDHPQKDQDLPPVLPLCVGNVEVPLDPVFEDSQAFMVQEELPLDSSDSVVQPMTRQNQGSVRGFRAKTLVVQALSQHRRERTTSRRTIPSLAPAQPMMEVFESSPALESLEADGTMDLVRSLCSFSIFDDGEREETAAPFWSSRWPVHTILWTKALMPCSPGWRALQCPARSPENQ
eukprot:NODE_145_length_2372_cov_86.002152_g126_i0.p1 GENE.NODE_145_length_2372_cov_86.002152_g126_i0~~NODE_145_length_2372_cov_86.002152_g126_i0.p1  ORF type:complete len:399 (-),score=71.38 NODE_145_length_2372_cov_86.002152_g126_i0:119-1315(-)